MDQRPASRIVLEAKIQGGTVLDPNTIRLDERRLIFLDGPKPVVVGGLSDLLKGSYFLESLTTPSRKYINKILLHTARLLFILIWDAGKTL